MFSINRTGKQPLAGTSRIRRSIGFRLALHEAEDLRRHFRRPFEREEEYATTRPHRSAKPMRARFFMGRSVIRQSCKV